MTDPVRIPPQFKLRPRRDSFAPAPPANILQSDMERGVKVRRVSTGQSRLYAAEFRFCLDQLAHFEHWVKTDLRDGAGEFYWDDPLSGGLLIASFDGASGAAYAPPNFGPGANATVAATLRVRPAPRATEAGS